ncbi:MAG: ATP-binding cassette domain-containing protein, partial [Candidatus Methanomethylophilaceae archaeon]|nr:ATP-binding cassette domain-containing protein [Candidatus Methanomethylophilaceae archaeon]
NLAMRNFNELSAGQHQKVAIARGLAQEPEVFLLDEPTSNLDVKHQVNVMKLLKKLSAERSMVTVMVSHDLNISARFADRMILMS